MLSHTRCVMSQRLFFLALLLISVFLLLSAQLYAQEESPSDSLVSISLKDGTTLKGKILRKDETTITVLTLGGLEVKAPLSSVISIQPDSCLRRLEDRCAKEMATFLTFMFSSPVSHTVSHRISASWPDFQSYLALGLMNS